ncbi:MAG: 6-phosphogluconolactonase [Pseudomonadota bacterium]
MDRFKLHVFETRDALHRAASEYCTEQLESALEDKQSAVFIGAGGTTPGPIYRQLSRKRLDWTKITVGITDERCVPPDHPKSNERLMRESLMQNKASDAKFLSMVGDGRLTIAQQVAQANTSYGEAIAICDLMLIGMGTDGHTLSWFPDVRGLEEVMAHDAIDWVAHIDASNSPVAGDESDRLTLTARAVKATRSCLLVITGDEKRRVLESGLETAPIERFAALCNQPVETYWAP